MADRFIAQYYFHGVLVHRVVKLSFSNKFSPINGSIRLDKHDIHAQLMRKQTFPCCVVTKLCFASYSCALFSFELWSLAMKTTVVSQREYGNRFKKRFSNVFWELIDLLMSLCFFGSFFSKIEPESWGAAYTRVRLIHECLW